MMAAESQPKGFFAFNSSRLFVDCKTGEHYRQLNGHLLPEATIIDEIASEIRCGDIRVDEIHPCLGIKDELIRRLRNNSAPPISLRTSPPAEAEAGTGTGPRYGHGESLAMHYNHPDP